jgi:mRNA interferase MazF
VREKAKRGEVWLADLGLAGKIRPVLILNIEFSDVERALYAIVPHTTSTRGGRFEVVINVPWLAAGAFDLQGIRPVPPPVLIRKLGTLSAIQMDQIVNVLGLWLGVKNMASP